MLEDNSEASQIISKGTRQGAICTNMWNYYEIDISEETWERRAIVLLMIV